MRSETHMRAAEHMSVSDRIDTRRPRATLTRSQRVLLVDDDRHDADLVCEMLVRGGWGADVEVIHVESLDGACEYLAETSVTCVLLDLSLPQVDGLDGLSRLRQAAPEVPIVVLSDHRDETVAMRAVHAGAQDYLIKGRVDDHLVSRAVRYAVERKRSEAQLLHQALHDALTELPNRAMFLDHVELALERSARTGKRIAVLFLDLDRFKLINDSLGHRAGDRLLCLVATRLRTVTREVDMVARFGGDEFTILCDDVTGEDDAVIVAERVAEAIAAPFAIEGTEVFLTASAGIAIVGQGAAADISAEALIRDADAAMHRAKERGKSRHELFDEVMRTTAVRRLETENALHRALERGEFCVHYQPTVALDSGQVQGLEALIRWQHPERGLVPPQDFVGLAEETGLIVPIGRWVLDEACSQLARWRELRRERGDRVPLTMAVNLSARQLVQEELANEVAQAIALHAVPPQSLVLELTESLVVGEDERTVEAFARLRELGIRLAIDDFGTGYASLASLKHFPADVLKIDRAFVAGLGRDSVDTPIVAAVIGLAHELGLVAVAEGVETHRQVQVLRRLGCDYAQGHLFSRAVSPAEIDKILVSGLSI